MTLLFKKLLAIIMDKDEKQNWQKIKEHFESLPEHKRDNMFYKRAVAICGGEDDPIELPEIKENEA